MSLVSTIVAKNRKLKKNMRMARIQQTPEQFVAQSLRNSGLMTIAMIFLMFLFFTKVKISLVLILPIAIVLFFIFYKFNMLKITAAIATRKKDIDKDVLFAGRYLLVKLNSGQPLINALIDASKSYGVAKSYFAEIVREIELGKPLEQAIAQEAEFSPSKKFRKILFQISNALRIGIDVTEFLDATLDEIAEQQIIEINRYGKKLSSITLFYMLIAIVFPSLGLTIFTVVESVSNPNIGLSFFLAILFFLALLQVIFLLVYKAIRPNVNI